MTLSPQYKELRLPRALTRQQYRHLAKGLRLLNDNDIVHGNIVGNVMLDAKTDLDPKTDLPSLVAAREFEMATLSAWVAEVKRKRWSLGSGYEGEMERREPIRF